MVSLFVWLQIKQQETLLEMQLTPFSILLRALLDQLQAKDQARIFTQPVDVNEVNFSRYLEHFFFPVLLLHYLRDDFVLLLLCGCTLSHSVVLLFIVHRS